MNSTKQMGEFFIKEAVIAIKINHQLQEQILQDFEKEVIFCDVS